MTEPVAEDAPQNQREQEDGFSGPTEAALLALFDGDGESIAEAGDGFDDGVAQGLAQEEDVLGEVGLLDDDAAPEVSEQLLAAYGAAGVFEEIKQDVELFGGKMHGLAGFVELPAFGIKWKTRLTATASPRPSTV
jgi:hypothetical protein